jgi:hypothetical protein
MYEAMLYSFLLRLCVPLWLKILQCFGKFQPWKSKRRCPVPAVRKTAAAAGICRGCGFIGLSVFLSRYFGASNLRFMGKSGL